jgi:threonylcarbamoyladenosine tRNA methylthiotransferase MtaB
MTQVKSVAFHTLGCKLNYAETSTLSRLLEREGFEKKEFEDEADVYVINTCSVTENADKECRQIVRKIQRQAPQGLVVITGCYAQLKAAEIAAIPGVDLVLGAAEKFQIASHLRELSKGDSARICSCDIEEVHGFNSSYSLSDRTRSFLKVQDGCDYNCSFCTIPLARGRSRSDTIGNLLKNAEELAAAGVKEIVLTGVNLGDFRDADKPDLVFFDLLGALDSVQGIERIRISSIEPNLLTEKIINFVAGSKRFMPHFHVPLQSGSNRILGLMRRRYKKELYAEKVNLIKTAMPHAAIGVDVIVGFPSETDSDFRESYEFLRDLDISYLHVFTYSERANTKALEISSPVAMTIRHERNKLLRNLSLKKMQFFKEKHQGEKRKVLFERQPNKGMMEGYTDNYIRVSTPYLEEWSNEVVDWRL